MPVVRSHLIDKKKLLKAPFFHTNCQSGLITGVTTGDGTAGHLFVLRNPSTTILAYITRLRFFWLTTTGFTAAQEMSLAAFKVTAYSAAHTGGTAVVPQPRRTAHATASVLTARIATTGALTAGTHTFGAQPLLRRGVVELADGAGVVKREFLGEWVPADPQGEVLASAEGIVIRNNIAMGAAGVGRLSVEVDHYER